MKKCALHTAKHDYYKQSRCTSAAQEQQSATPMGVINVNEDSDDDEAYVSEQKEVNAEMQELNASEEWVNQPGWENGIDLRLEWRSVHATLQKGNDATAKPPSQQQNMVEYDKWRCKLDDLDPTQRAFANRVLAWGKELVEAYTSMRATGIPRKPPLLRTWLCGSAGSGKSTTLKVVVVALRDMFEAEGIPAEVALTAYTGIAAFNIGFGAKTACSCFGIFPNVGWKQNPSSTQQKKMEAQWANVELLIIDEISFIGKAFFARAHFRLQLARRAHFAEHALDPDDSTFGDVSIILVGDFGQLEPIDDFSLCELSLQYNNCPKNLRHLWKHAKVGHLLVQTFDEAFILNNIHRSSSDLWWTESCLRLRNFNITRADYDIWLTHDLDRGHLTSEQKHYFEDKALWLCARCEDVGSRNGRKLAQMAANNKQAIHRIYAVHNSKRNSVKKKSSSSFGGLRSVLNLVQGCRVLLVKNLAYLYGLANGSRGSLVGIVYGADGIGSFPEALVVDMPDYCGPCFYKDHPTWVPILPNTEWSGNQSRHQFPIVAGFAITINKSQGITAKEGIVVNLNGSARYKPAGKHGLPFVAFTRSESFAMTAFKTLPGFEEFCRGKDSDMLKARQAFIRKLELMHQRTLARHSAMQSGTDEQRAFAAWSKQASKSPCAPDSTLVEIISCPGQLLRSQVSMSILASRLPGTCDLGLRFIQHLIVTNNEQPGLNICRGRSCHTCRFLRVCNTDIMVFTRRQDVPTGTSSNPPRTLLLSLETECLRPAPMHCSRAKAK